MKAPKSQGLVPDAFKERIPRAHSVCFDNGKSAIQELIYQIRTRILRVDETF